jgi:hypothetical protein
VDLHFGYTGLPGTVSAAEKCSVCFYTVSDDFAAAVIANRRQLLDCAFEAVKRMTITCRDYLERQIIVVATHLTLCHGVISCH